MLIAHLRFPVSPADRRRATDALLADLRTVRSMRGCNAFLPVHDAADDAVVGVVHEWECEADFAAYTASDVFRRLGATVRPLMTGTPVSRRFRAELIETVT